MAAAYAECRPWLRNVHCHVGSQGCGLELLAAGAAALSAFLVDRGIRVEVFNIGGGLPVAYADGDMEFTFQQYADYLASRVPRALAAPHTFATEFGRIINAHCGVAVARVEYVKEAGGKRTAVVHAGADLFLREIYAPDTWQHRFVVLSADGTLKGASDGRRRLRGEPEAAAVDGEASEADGDDGTGMYRLAGPLCFQVVFCVGGWVWERGDGEKGGLM